MASTNGIQLLFRECSKTPSSLCSFSMIHLPRAAKGAGLKAATAETERAATKTFMFIDLGNILVC